MLKKWLLNFIILIMLISGCDITPSTTQPDKDENSNQNPQISDNKEGIVMAEKEKYDFNTDLTVDINSKVAKVKTAQGLSYTATGFKLFESGTFIINTGFTITFDDELFNKEFNRYILCYKSSAALKGIITYKENNNTKSEYFFLEEGKETFCCLIEDYLKNNKAEHIQSITFEIIKGSTAEFSLCDLKTEIYKLYSNDTYYIENNRFKVGIRLLWGGGISYISDSENKIQGLTNLVNQADEGRLIQQSYYGTGANGEYTPGVFNNSKWSYNPVQGGDRFRNQSRIIDVVVKDYSVYIKAQPQDWSLNNALTPSYMENCYTVYDDCIRVDNRFVDFSGWNHPYSHQELPAFYTVSYLDKFTWYNGSDSWKDDKLSSRTDLNFWGDPKYSNDCRFYVKKSNTETWCSWTNKDVDYGIGLFVPNVDSFYAGKHAYNGSKDPANGACNYVAPVNTIQLVSFVPLEYSYLITTGSVSEIRNVFKDYKDFAKNDSLHHNYQSMRVNDIIAPGENVLELVSAANNCATPSNNSNVKTDSNNNTVVFSATQTGEDPQAVIDFSEIGDYSADEFNILTMEYMIPNYNNFNHYGYEFFLCTGNVTNATAGISIRGDYICDGKYHKVEMPLNDLGFWNGDIHKIRFDFFNETAPGDVVIIKSIKLS